MYRVTTLFVLILVSVFLACTALAQNDTASATATCNYDQDKQLVVEYQHVALNGKKPPFGKVWAPGGKPMTLFTNTPIQLGSRTLPMGAYTLFAIPSSKQWTLILSKSTDTSGAYDEKQDLVRVPMDSGELPNAVTEFNVSFAHIAPDQCSLRLDADKYGHFAVLQER